MNELGMQALIVDAVNGAGGFARKLSNRFLVGVVDLLVKLPDYPAGVLEVKQRDLPKNTELAWKLDVTGPQVRFLRDAHAAGMPAGVASFMHRRGSGPLERRLHLGVWTYGAMVVDGWTARYGAHEPLWGKNGSAIDDNIMTLLRGWLDNCEIKNDEARSKSLRRWTKGKLK